MSLQSLLADKGLVYGLQHAATAAWHRLRDRSLSRKFNTVNFRCARMPHIAGLSHIHIAKNFSAGDSLWLEAVLHYAGEQFNPQLTIGENVNVSDNVHIACTNSVTIGGGTLIGSRVIITDHAHGKYSGNQQSAPSTAPAQRRLSRDGVVVIGSNVWIGDGVAVLAGANIGDGCIIGANSVVTGPIAPDTIAVGTPARPIRLWDKASATWRTFSNDA